MNIKLLTYVLYLWLVTVRCESTCRVPDVYEFCSALTNIDGHAGSQLLERQIQQGKPGKRGGIGSPGPRGEKGERGEQGTCQNLEEKLRRLEEKIDSKFDLIPKLVYCGMGMKNGEIPDSAITASSRAGHIFAAYFGRLDARVVESPTDNHITSVGAWCPSSNSGQWIQVDLGTPKSVSGIVTQGRPLNHWGNQCWVESYKVSCGATVATLKTITQNGVQKVFVGNTDKDTKVTIKFPEPLICRYVRLYVLSWNTVSPWVRPCMRMEVLKGECYELL